MAKQTKLAFLLLFDLVLLGGVAVAAYYGWALHIWHDDILGISFALVAIYFAAALAYDLDRIGGDLLDDVANHMPMIALIGTVFGIITAFDVLRRTQFSGPADFKALIGPLLAGGGSAMWPTFFGLTGAVLLWVHRIAQRGQ
jgi:hypothetical protein